MYKQINLKREIRMKKMKIAAILMICMIFGVNAFAAGHPPRYQQNNNYSRNVKAVKYIPVKPKPSRTVTKTVVVHHYEQPRYNNVTEAAAIVGLGIIATAAIAKAIF